MIDTIANPPLSPIPSLRHLPSRCVYDFKTETPVYSSCGVPTDTVRLFECRGSGMRFRVPPDREALAQLHNEGYQKFYGDGTPEYAQAHLEKLTQRVRFLADYLPTGKALDVGCSTGLMMKALDQAGFDAFGCDVSEEACVAAAKEFDRDRICHGAADGALDYFGEGAFDAVTAMDVIEHFHDAEKELRAIHALLKPGGILFVRTPSLSSPFFSIADWSYRLSLGRYTRAVQTIYHAEHIYFFNRRGLRMLLEETGFETVVTAPDPLPWRTFRMAELNHGALVNTALALVYFLSRITGGGHGMQIIARRRVE